MYGPPPIQGAPRIPAMTRKQSGQAPVVIVGAGLAGLTVALHLAADRPVVVLA